MAKRGVEARDDLYAEADKLGVKLEQVGVTELNAILAAFGTSAVFYRMPQPDAGAASNTLYLAVAPTDLEAD